jgi:CHC2 zinc finger
MSVRNDDLRWKIDEAKRRLPLPELLRQLGYSEKHIGKTAHCPFHSDEHKSFSVFHSEDGKGWQWKCFAGCGEGDEIGFLRKLKGLSMTGAMNLYLRMAGFPASAPHRSHEYPRFPQSPKCPESPVSLVYPVSNGQGLEEELKCLAARCACSRTNKPAKRRFELARSVRAVEKKIGRKLTTAERMLAFDEWCSVSGWWLGPETRDDHLASFLAEIGKVRVPTGEGETIKKTLECVSTLPVSELPVLPGVEGAAESWRRVAALHRELSRRCANKTYFLSCRDAAKAFPGLSHQTAYNINLALAQLGVIEIVRKGQARLNGGKASEFRYLLPPIAQKPRPIADSW